MLTTSCWENAANAIKVPCQIHKIRFSISNHCNNQQQDVGKRMLVPINDQHSVSSAQFADRYVPQKLEDREQPVRPTTNSSISSSLWNQDDQFSSLGRYRKSIKKNINSHEQTYRIISKTRVCMPATAFSATNIAQPNVIVVICQNEPQRFISRIRQPCCCILSALINIIIMSLITNPKIAHNKIKKQKD